jgi:hypothetical protein
MVNDDFWNAIKPEPSQIVPRSREHDLKRPDRAFNKLRPNFFTEQEASTCENSVEDMNHHLGICISGRLCPQAAFGAERRSTMERMCRCAKFFIRFQLLQLYETRSKPVTNGHTLWPFCSAATKEGITDIEARGRQDPRPSK